MSSLRSPAAALVLVLAACSPSSSPGPSPSPAKAPSQFQVKFETTKGDFTLDINREWSPLGADRFHEMVQGNLFEGARFFRVVPGFVIQFGLKGVPEVDNRWESAVIEDDPHVISNTQGTISFATRGPRSRTNQVFINMSNNERLDAMGFTPVGRVSAGMRTLFSINGEYGERPDQGRIRGEGNAYLEREFPNLDYIRKASIVR